MTPRKIAPLSNSLTGKRKPDQTPIVFSERRVKRTREDAFKPSESPAILLPPEPARPLKKPGRGARTLPKSAVESPRPATPTSGFNIQAPSGAVLPWDVDSEKLAAEMQAYTLQEIGRSLAATESPPRKESTKLSTPTKFKPKQPKLRYHERNGIPDSNMQVEQTMEDEEMEDGDYIIDTYIRMPANAVASNINEEQNFGLLVLDGDADIDEFYKDLVDSDEEDEEEEEDENAENHYSADYPDEEVDSDDEFGRNPYNYRHSNMDEPEDNYSDSEDEAAFSDDEGVRHPWKKQLISEGFGQ